MNLAKRALLVYIRTKFKLLSAISKKKAATQAFQLFCTPPTRDKQPLPDLFREAEQIEFPFQDYRIAGYRWNAGATRKFLILHGFESSAINFAAYVEPMKAKGFEVLAFDAPAHGYSSGRRLTALIYRDLVKYIHAEFGPITNYLGHSLGGFVLSLTLAEIPHDASFRAVFIAPSTKTSSAITSFFRLIDLGQPVRVEFEKHIEAISGHPVGWFSIDRAMQSINARILWIHDETDQVTPFSDAATVAAKNYSNLQFVHTHGLGHSRIYRDPQVIQRVIGFFND